jgi:Ni2+-binding GTPase involved in maturation of urease and hydrogenase
MEADALRMRVKRPFVFTNLKSGEGAAVADGIVRHSWWCPLSMVFPPFSVIRFINTSVPNLLRA